MKTKRSLSEWLSWQEKLHLSEIDLGLDRIGKVAEKLGIFSPDKPQSAYLPFPIITVAGTNGKGSCVALLESMLRAEGYKTGVYTSPHLIRYNERIAINGQSASDKQICEAFEKIDIARRDIDGNGTSDDISLTYFEFGTLAAILCFLEQKVDVVVLEVGLGGRLDAANLWDASLAIITGIAIDHVSWLGNDREKIAIEKSGIMRRNHPVISGDPNPPKSINKEAERIGAQLYQINQDFSYNKIDNESWMWSGWAHNSEHTKPQYTLPLPALTGDFQLNNAATCLAGLSAIKEQLPISQSAIAEGLLNVSIPGRMQIIQKQPEWLLDVAHNPQSAEQLAHYLKHSPIKGNTYAIFSMLEDKDIGQVISLMNPHIDTWHLVELSGSRGMDKEKLRQQMNKQAVKGDLYLHDDFSSVCQHLKNTVNNEDRVVAFGSFLVVSGVLEYCEF